MPCPKLAKFLRRLAIITCPMRRAPDTGEAADANDAFSLVKWVADTAICARPGGSSAKSQRRTQLEGVLPKSITASDVGQTFLSAGSGDFPVPEFRVKLSSFGRQSWKTSQPAGSKARITIWATRPQAAPQSSKRTQSLDANARAAFFFFSPSNRGA